MTLSEKILELIKEKIIADFEEDWDNLTEEYQDKVNEAVLEIIRLVLKDPNLLMSELARKGLLHNPY